MSDDGITWPGKSDGFNGHSSSPGIAVPYVPEETDPNMKHYEVHMSPYMADDLEEYALKHQLTPSMAIGRFVMKCLEGWEKSR